VFNQVNKNKTEQIIFQSSIKTHHITSYSQYFKNRKYNPTVLLQEIICRLFPQQLAERKQVHEAEMEELSK